MSYKLFLKSLHEAIIHSLGFQVLLLSWHWVLLYPVTAQLLVTVSETYTRGHKGLPYTVITVLWDSDSSNFIIMEYISVASLYHSVMDCIKLERNQGSHFICQIINFILKIINHFTICLYDSIHLIKGRY